LPATSEKVHREKGVTRAPVGSLANNPEWNGIISEIESASKYDALSHE